MNELALFAGAGGGVLGGHLLGWNTVCAVEREDYARRVLLARQRDGMLPRFPIWDDVCTFQGAPWKGRVQVISGGFPCQDVAICGSGKGLDGEKSGLWSEMARIVGEVLPRFVFIENSPLLTSRGLKRVLWDLAQMGYDARWGVLGAYQAGAPHRRNRIWIVACNPDSNSKPVVTLHDETPRLQELDAHSVSNRLQGVIEARAAQRAADGSSNGGPASWWKTEPDVGRVVDGMANRVDRLKAIGNGQVPSVAALAWRILAAPWI